MFSSPMSSFKLVANLMPLTTNKILLLCWLASRVKLTLSGTFYKLVQTWRWGAMTAWPVFILRHKMVTSNVFTSFLVKIIFQGGSSISKTKEDGHLLSGHAKISTKKWLGTIWHFCFHDIFFILFSLIFVTHFSYLLENGADPLISDAEGNISLHWAALSGSYKTCELLMNYGCDVNATNSILETPL